MHAQRIDTLNVDDRVIYPGAISSHAGVIVGFNDDGDPRIRADRTGNVWVIAAEHVRLADA